MLRVAIATYRGLARLNTDDLVLKKTMEDQGMNVSVAIWNESHHWEKYDIVLIRSCWDYIHAPKAFQSWIEHLHMNGVCVLNPPGTVAWNINKSYLKDLAFKSLPTVPTIWVNHGQKPEMGEMGFDLISTNKLVLKPSVGNDAHGIRVVDRDELAISLHNMHHEAFFGEILIQPFLTSVIEEGEWSLIFIDQEYSHTILKKPASGDIRSQHTRGGTFLRMDPPADALDVATRTINLCPPSVYARVDLLRLEGGFVIGEVEMIEPYLYFHDSPGSAQKMVAALLKAYDLRTKESRDYIPLSRNSPGSENINIALDAWYQHMERHRHFQIGHPITQDLDHSDMDCFINLPIHKIEDPFGQSNHLNSIHAERQVLDFFAHLFHAPMQDYWGYITNGQTECNLYGHWAARTRFPDAPVYYSDESHYSMEKIIDILNMKGLKVPTNTDGTICLDTMAEFARKYRHDKVIWHANVGTTMKGAVDDIEHGINALRKSGVKEIHVHCDAALFGPMLPFYEHSPVFDFGIDEVASIAVSSHHFLGCPMPVGMILSRKSPCTPGKEIESIAGIDARVSGSRNGLAAILMWREIKKLGMQGLGHRAARCLEMTLYTLARLDEVGISAWAHPYSNTVVFPRPTDSLVTKWHLASQGDLSHIVLMPGIETNMIDEFINDFSVTNMGRKEMVT